MNPTAAAKLFRRHEVGVMEGTCTITRVARTWNDTTNRYDETSTAVYSGKCRIVPTGTGQRRVQAGDRDVTLRTFDVRVPADTAAGLGDTVTVVSSPDAGLVGVEMVVIDVRWSDWQVVRHLVCEVQT